MPGVVEFGQNRLHKFLVARIGGADKIVIRQFQFFGERQPVRRERVAVFLRIFFLGERGLLDFLAVLVEAGQEKNFPAEAAIARARSRRPRFSRKHGRDAAGR